ncbi:hypothetical protein AUP68_04132 [Ilyonectria robusta]
MDMRSDTTHHSRDSTSLGPVSRSTSVVKANPVGSAGKRSAFSRSPSSSVSGDRVWDQHDGASSTDTRLSSLPSDLAEPVDFDNEDHCSPWQAPGEPTATDLSGDHESYNPDIGGSPTLGDDYHLTHSSYFNPSMPLPTLFSVSPALQETYLSDMAISSIYQNLDYLDRGGNHAGVELLDQRIRQEKAEYLVRWKGRPDSERSWEKETTNSYSNRGHAAAAAGLAAHPFRHGALAARRLHRVT